MTCNAVPREVVLVGRNLVKEVEFGLTNLRGYFHFHSTISLKIMEVE